MKQNYFNKKAVVGEMIAQIFLFMIFAFIIVIVSVIFVYIGNTTETRLKSMDVTVVDNWNETVDIGIGGVNNAYGTLNWLTTFIILGYAMAILIGCFFSKEHPIVFFVYLFISIIAIIVSVPIANGYYNLYLNTELNPTFLGFNSSSYILFHLPVFMTVLALMGATIMSIR